MTERNPHAPKKALTRKDIKKGMIVVLHRGSHQVQIEITSNPRRQAQVVADSSAPKGGTRKAYFYWVEYHALGSLNFSSKTTLTEMGVCPDHEGKWTTDAYVLRADKGKR